MPRPTLILRAVAVGLLIPLIALVALVWFGILSMPGHSFAGSLPPLTARQRKLALQLRSNVVLLASSIGNRSTVEPDGLARAAGFIDAELRSAGYEPRHQRFSVAGESCENLEVEVPGSSLAREVVVVGAHYDAVPETVGADDNASGTAALLALAKVFRAATSERTLRFVWFTNEEEPHFQSASMGSAWYANRAAQQHAQIVAMLSLETLGYYSDRPHTQRYPSPLERLYPDTGNFVGFVGNLRSRSLVSQALASFRRVASFPSEGGALPAALPGVGWSDQWAFWRAGYRAIMVTDTAPFRNPYYHTQADTPDKLDYERLARVTEGLQTVIADLAGAQVKPVVERALHH